MWKQEAVRRLGFGDLNKVRLGRRSILFIESPSTFYNDLPSCCVLSIALICLAGGAGVPLGLLRRLSTHFAGQSSSMLPLFRLQVVLEFPSVFWDDSVDPFDPPLLDFTKSLPAGGAGVPLRLLGRLGRLLGGGGGALGGGPRPLLHVVGEYPFWGVCCKVEQLNNVEQGWGAAGRPLLHLVGELPWGAVALGCTPNTRCWSRAGERKGGCCFMRCLRAVGRCHEVEGLSITQQKHAA